MEQKDTSRRKTPIHETHHIGITNRKPKPMTIKEAPNTKDEGRMYKENTRHTISLVRRSDRRTSKCSRDTTEAIHQHIPEPLTKGPFENKKEEEKDTPNWIKDTGENRLIVREFKFKDLRRQPK